MKTLNVNMRIHMVFFGIAFCILALAPAAAQSPRVWQGKVDYVDLKAGVIVVGDVTFNVNASTRVLTATSSSGTLQSLAKGVKVRLNAVAATPTSRPVVTDIQIVPSR